MGLKLLLTSDAFHKPSEWGSTKEAGGRFGGRNVAPRPYGLADGYHWSPKNAENRRNKGHYRGGLAGLRRGLILVRRRGGAGPGVVIDGLKQVACGDHLGLLLNRFNMISDCGLNRFKILTRQLPVSSQN